MTKWTALANISLPRANDPAKNTDLIMAGETFDATDKQVENLLRPKTGPPRVARAAAGGNAVLLQPRQTSGPVRGPAGDARPDPPGSSHIQVAIPEEHEPSIGSENVPEVDALDLPPGTRITAGV